MISLFQDVWSFGIVMWEIFSYGNDPYPWTDVSDVGRKVCDMKNPLRNDQPDICPDGVYALMKSCWSFLPAKRPSFQSILSQLKELHAAECQDPTPIRSYADVD